MKKLTKQVGSLALSACMAFGLVGCGGSAASSGAVASAAGASAGSPIVDASALDGAEYLSGDYTPLPADGPTYELTLGHAGAETAFQHQFCTAFAEALSYYSDGKINITVYPNSQLGSDSEIIASVVAGDVDIAYQSGSTHASLVLETQIFDTPFLFSGYDMDKIQQILTNGEFRTLYDAANEKANLKCLLVVAANSMNLTSNRPVTSLADLKGLKIRTAQSESRMAIWSALGANPTPLAFSELYMALQNGTVDAQDNSFENAVTSGAAEVQKYLIPTQSMMPSMDLTMNLDKFNSMPREYQDLMLKISDELLAYDFAVLRTNDQKFHDQLVNDYGLEECTLSDEVRSQMREAAAPAVNSVKAAIGNDAIYEALQKELDA